MKIQCPNCKKITELEHADRGSMVECVCSFVFAVNDQTIVEEFTEVDSKLPERIGQYKVTGFIGFGGMGKVFLGEHPNLGIPVAIKTLRIEYMTDEASCERFVQSAKICARVTHPNIVRIYDCGYENGNVYLVMEYITNGSAQTLLDQEGKLDPEYAAFIMLEVCSGLMEAEKHGIVHRDIKPENIMFDQEGTVKILDLGLSKIIGDNRIGKESITVSLTALGTPLYMAPEQAVDAANCDSRADIYSIGVTLYQLCTGKLPFDSDDPHELRRMHALEKPVPPRQLAPELMPDLETIILRCMEKKREDRYASITDLALDLEAYLKNRVLPSSIRQNSQPQQHPVRKHGTEGSRRMRYLWVAYFRQIPRPMRRLLLAGLIAALALSAAVIFFMQSEDHQVQVRRTPAPITAEKILTALSRQAAVYLPDQDYGPVMALYRNYRGALEEETRAARLRIADGYQLTQRQAAADLQTELAELLLQERFEPAMELFQKQHGPNLCPECSSLLRALLDMPRLFQIYWQNRRGQELELAFFRGGRIPLRINDADQFEVYAVRTDNRRQIRFKWDDLALDEQLKIIGASGSGAVRHFWTGSFLLRQGKTEPAAEAFEQIPVFGPALSGLVRSGFDPKGSGRDSGRSR